MSPKLRSRRRSIRAVFVICFAAVSLGACTDSALLTSPTPEREPSATVPLSDELANSLVALTSDASLRLAVALKQPSPALITSLRRAALGAQARDVLAVESALADADDALAADASSAAVPAHDDADRAALRLHFSLMRALLK